MVRLLQMSLLFFCFGFNHSVSAQLHQPSIPSYRAVGGQHSLINMQSPGDRQSRSGYQPSRQFQQPSNQQPMQAPLHAPDRYLPNPIQPQLQRNSIPAVPRALPGAGGHTFGAQPQNGSVQSDQLYHSPYKQNGQKFSSPGSQGFSANESSNHCVDCGGWQWQLLPKDLLYKSYLGGPREPRFGQGILYLQGTGLIWALEAGGRAGLIRFGSGPGEPLAGWQLDVWGAAHPRLNMNEGSELEAVDFKVGVPLTWTNGPVQLKFEWNHISSHLGDEFMLRNPAFPRIDYLRDSFVLGGGFFPNPDLRLYAEAEYSFNALGGSEPWHFQFGVDYSPVCVSQSASLHPQPFFAINGHLREEVNYSGGVNVVTGWQWRGLDSNALFRMGFQYYQGQSLQYEFLGDYEELYGIGMWYDF